MDRAPGNGTDRAPGNGTDRTPAARRGALLALAYYALYMVYHFWRPETDRLHWLGLVLVPFLLMYALDRAPGADRSLVGCLASVGLRRGNLKKGLWWALALGLAISALAALASNRRTEVWDVLTSFRAFYMLPIAFLLLLLTAAFTEEFFFRGIVQTRLTDWTRSRTAGVLITSLLFGVYHIPYAYVSPNWPTHGDLGAAVSVALWEGGLGGLVLGFVYVLAGRNLVAPILVHALIDLFPALALIRFGGG